MSHHDAAEEGFNKQHSPDAPVKSGSVVQRSLQGWRLVGVLSSLALGLLLAIIETSITATALVTIGDYFGNSTTVTWVVLAYLLSYMGFATIFARLSDGIGREAAVILAYVLFGAFSLGGGLAQTLTQLIALRVLQGIGGAGLYSMFMVVGPEIMPVQHLGALSGMIGIILAVGSVLGPILGGAITQRASWRWIYLFNAPAAAVGIAMLLICWPRRERTSTRPRISSQSLQQVDWLGAVLLLGGSTLVVFALQEGGSTAFSWSSPAIISAFTISGFCWIAFFAWTSWLSFGPIQRLRAIFPITIALSKPVGPAIILVFLTGFPYFAALINLPQRFQVVNGDSPIMAGVHLIPLLCSMAFGSFLGGAASSRKNLTSQTLIIASCLIVLGCGLLSTLSSGREFYKPTYGYQVILGLGVGLTFSGGTLMTSLASKSEDMAAAQGALSQSRVLGGSIGLSMATIVLNRKLSQQLQGVLEPAKIQALEQSLNTIGSLSPAGQARVGQVYVDSFNEQMRICTYISLFALLAALATYQRNPVSVAAMKERRRAMMDKSSDGETGMSSMAANTGAFSTRGHGVARSTGAADTTTERPS